jgi:hypothetical protein
LKTPESDSDVVGVLRRGDIVEIESKVASNIDQSYIVEVVTPDGEYRGWVSDVDLDTYDTQAQARTAGSGG